MMVLDKNFKEFIELLNVHGVKYDTLIDFLGIDDLIAVKKIAGRLQDLADADNLEKLKKKKE